VLLADSGYTGWYVGLAVAAGVVVIVVVLVGLILMLAHKISEQAMQITLGLDDSRANTWPLWQVSKVDDAVKTVTRQAAQARGLLESEL